MQGGGSRTGTLSHYTTRIKIPAPAQATAAVVVTLSFSSSSSPLKIKVINRSISGLPAYSIVTRYSRPAIANTNDTLHTRSISMQLPLPVAKKKMKSRFITISTSDGKWHGNWNCDYTFFLRQFLDDDGDDVDKDTEVTISLCIQKHAGLGMSVEGRINTCFTRKCCHCYTPYLRHIDTPFKVWILPSSRSSNNSSKRQQMNITSTESSLDHENYTLFRSVPDIGTDDDSLSLQNSTFLFGIILLHILSLIFILEKTRLQVIYVKPGSEADLDSLIQDTIRLATSVKETCSEACENSEPKLQHLGVQNAASIERRWHKLLELKKNIS